MSPHPATQHLIYIYLFSYLVPDFHPDNQSAQSPETGPSIERLPSIKMSTNTQTRQRAPPPTTHRSYECYKDLIVGIFSKNRLNLVKIAFLYSQ